MAAALRKSKSRGTAPGKAAVQRSQASNPAGNQHLSEASLRKLSRAELQKLAREHAIKANLKSEHIIQNLLKVVSAEKKNIRPAERDHEEGPSKKRARAAKTPLPSTPESRLEALLDETKKPQLNDPHPASQPSPITPGAESLKDPALDPDLYSDTDSEMTDVTQPSYGTPKSSRANTPQPSDVYDAKRTVDIMQVISEKDLEMLAEIANLRETTAKLRKQTQDIRDSVCSERARRERMEAYFTYWQNIEGTWPRKWLYGESMLPQKYLRPNGGDVAGPPTLPTGRRAREGDGRNGTAATAQKREESQILATVSAAEGDLSGMEQHDSNASVS